MWETNTPVLLSSWSVLSKSKLNTSKIPCWSCLKIFRVLFKLKFAIKNPNSGSFHHISELWKNLLSYTLCILAEISLMILQYIILVEISSTILQYHIFPSCLSISVMNGSPGNFSSIWLLSLLVILKLTGVAWDDMWGLSHTVKPIVETSWPKF